MATPQRAPERRETFAALRATHAAHRIASAVRDAEPIDVHTGYCRACGAKLDVRDNVNGIARCGGCGARVRVPAYAVVWTCGHARGPWRVLASYPVTETSYETHPEDFRRVPLIGDVHRVEIRCWIEIAGTMLTFVAVLVWLVLLSGAE